MTNAKRVLIALPAKDEERKIGEVLDQIKAHFPDIDVLVVDDGSGDGTAGVARSKKALLLSHRVNLGYAAALQSAREYALNNHYENLILCDADGQHEPQDIGKIIEPLIGRAADYVIASRELGSSPRLDPVIHKYGRKLYSFLVSLLFFRKFRIRITDSSSGFKGWNRNVMEIFSGIYKTSNRLRDGRINDLEELFIIAARNLKVLEVPGRFYKRKDDISRIYADYGISGKAFKIKDFYYLFFRWPALFVRTVMRNLFQ